MTTGKLRLRAVSGDYDRIRALKTGEVGIDGCELDYLILSPGETFKRLFRTHEFDIAEMSFSTYMLALSKGDFPYRAIPVFLSRVFPHCSIYVRTDRGIAAPHDLKGKLVGVPNYHFTRGLVVRGMLQDEYGIKPQDLRWRVGGIDAPDDFNYVDRPSPPGVHIEFGGDGACLGEELKDGRLDAIISYRDPQVFVDRAPHIARLFPDFRAAEQDWYRRTGVFPAMHVVGIRSALVERHPSLPLSICRAFHEAKRRCQPQLFDLDALAVSLPWLVAEAEATARLMGPDFWPYGVAKNRRMIEAQARWSLEQGLSTVLRPPEELFITSTLDWDP
ncbi:MAG TPA: ABC transporter substrate-binding protein [Alphaproteobacteria bacterium]|nr:ABC transporter substrate-binding protein [Alphaproteobacteria bacterium]